MNGKWMNRKVLTGVLAVLLCGLTLAAEAGRVKLDVAMGEPVMLAGRKQPAYLRVAMTGIEPIEMGRRMPVNVALVLDVSGSMSGQKIEHAKQAAIMALDRLRSDDIVSVVVYESCARVVVPATRLQDGHSVRQAIMRLEAGGNTALFAGVSKGANEVRKFLERGRVNRVILLSDGLANVGPSSPGALGELGMSLGREGMAVTTIGLGLDYNEDLMTRLALRSDGNHFFAEDPTELARVFEREFGDVLSVVAQDVTVRIECRPGIRPVRTLGRKADIAGQVVMASLNQIYGNQTKYILLEVEVPAGERNSSRDVASVRVGYATRGSEHRTRMESTAGFVTFTDNPEAVEARRNLKVMASVARQIGAERNRVAMELRDTGKVEEARELLELNTTYLRRQADATGSKWLEKDAVSNEFDSRNLDAGAWTRQRKSMQFQQQEAIQALGYVDE